MKNKIFILPMLLTIFLGFGTRIFSMERPRVKLSARITSSVEDLRRVVNQYRNKKAKAINVIDTFYKIDNRSQAQNELNRLGVNLNQLSKEARRDYLAKDEPTPTTRRPILPPKAVPTAVPTPPTPKAKPAPEPKRKAPSVRKPLPTEEKEIIVEAEVQEEDLLEAPELSAEEQKRQEAISFLNIIKNLEPHEVLNIHENANEEQIKNAYKVLARKWHPDKNLEIKEEASEIFKHIANARDALLERF